MADEYKKILQRGGFLPATPTPPSPPSETQHTNNAAPRSEVEQATPADTVGRKADPQTQPRGAAPSLAPSAEEFAPPYDDITSEQVAEQMHYAFRQAELLEEQGVHDVTAKVLRDVARMLGALQKESSEIRKQLAKERVARLREQQSATSSEGLTSANVALANESAKLRGLLSELVEAGDAFDNRDDIPAAAEEAAQQRWDKALEAARPFTEEALLQPSAAPAARRTPELGYLIRRMLDNLDQAHKHFTAGTGYDPEKYSSTYSEAAHLIRRLDQELSACSATRRTCCGEWDSLAGKCADCPHTEEKKS